MLPLDPQATVEHGDPLDDVSQFAYVARPGVDLHLAHGLAGKPFGIDAHLSRELPQEAVRQEGNIARALAQRGQRNGHDVQPIVEVGAEGPGFDHLHQAAIGGGDEPDIHFMLRRIANFPQTARFQHPQQLALRFQAQVGDFVQEQRALVGDLEKPAFRGNRPGKRALDVPEQFALQERGSHAVQSQANNGQSRRRLC